MLHSFGRGKDERLGHADGGKDHTAPCVIEALRGAVIEQVALGNCHGAAVTAAGELYIWGGGAFGELGLGDDVAVAPAPRPLPALRSIRVVSISCGFYHSACVTEDGSGWTWGWGREGQLGHAEACSSPGRIEAFASMPVSRVACGHRSSCFLTRECNVCWFGELIEQAPPQPPSTPTHVADEGALLRMQRAELPDGAAVGLSAGGRHAAAVLVDGSMWTWGSGAYGQLGLGDTTSRAAPARVVGLQQVRMGCCGEDHTAAIGCRSDEAADSAAPPRPTVWIWGRSDYGSRLAAQVRPRAS